VAIAGAVMVGLGFKPFQSAVLNLLAQRVLAEFPRDLLLRVQGA
jgi:L-lactate permease